MSGTLRVRLTFAALIALCALGAWAGVDDRLEGTLHDLAVRSGLYEVRLDEPPPIVVVGIDDNTLEFMSDSTLGREGGQIRWPWPRSVHAAVVDELDRLGARTIVFDVMFGDADRPADDAAFADAIERHGGVVLAARLAREGVYDGGTPEPADLRRALDAREGAGLGVGEDARSLLLAIESGTALNEQERQAIAALAGEEPSDLERNRAARLLDTALTWARAQASDLVAEGVDRAVLPGMDDRALFPTPAVARGMAGVGNTDMGASSGEADAVVRRVPLWVRERDRAYPLLGLAGAMHFAGETSAEVDASSTRFGGTLDDAPTTSRYMPGFDASVGGVARVRWPRGDSEWRTQFDVDGERRFFSVLEVLNLPPLRRRAMESFASVNDQAVFAAAVLGGPVSEERLTALAVELTEMSPTEGAWEGTTQRLAEAWGGLRDHARAIAEDEATDQATADFARSFVETEAQEAAFLADARAYREQAEALAPVNGSIVFIGSVATKVANDIVATSVNPETPGVFVHAAIAWSVLSGQHLPPAHPWLPPLLAVLLGYVGVMLGQRSAQVTGLFLVVGLCAVWMVFATSVLDARAGLGSVTAPPALSLFVVWLARATYRSLVELRARRLTEERFKSYVAPDVVDILVSNPELSSMEPQRRELTIMFTDIAGFTTMAERLGTQRTTEVLSEYLASMTDVLESTGATLDKYLGDGIMAFWGAPLANERHAQSACEAAVRMLDALDELNARDVFGEVGPAQIRIGIATGVVSVGDFGNPPLRSAYTVIGDTVNLSARLESANKQLGASICINARCAELLGDEMRTRAVGPLVVVGKSQPEPIRELLGGRTPKGERTDAWVELHESASAAFLVRDWDVARGAYTRLRDEFGDEKIAALHLEAIERLAGDDVTPPSIELTEK